MALKVEIIPPEIIPLQEAYERFEEELEEDKKTLVEALGLAEIDEIWYKNYPNVIKRGIDITSIITEERLDELEKCSNDPFYFLENYIFIQSKDYGTIQFKLRSFQREMIELFEGERFVLIKMGRQLGKTIVCMAYFLWNVLFKKNFNIMMFANEDELAKENVTRLKDMYERLPLWMKDGVEKYNEKMIKFENKSSIKSRVANKKSGRGGTNDILYCDEMGLIEETIMRPWKESALPSIESAKRTKFFATSTPKGMNTFWKLFTEAQAKINSFVAREYPWNVDGLRNEDFKERIIEDHGIRHWEQEYEAKFLGTSGTLLPSEVLERFLAMKPIEEKKIFDLYDLKIFKHPEKNRRYIATHDSSEGLGEKNDYTAIHVIDITNPLLYEQVAVLNNNEIDEDDAPFIIAEICRYYNNAFEISENNFLPEIPKNIVKNADYDNIYFHTDGRAGIKMVETRRTKGLTRMRKDFVKSRMIIHDAETIFQFMVFSKNGKKYEAEAGRHDDLVTSLNLFFWLIADEDRFEEYISDKIDYFQDVKNLDNEGEDPIDIAVDDGEEISSFSGFKGRIGGRINNAMIDDDEYFDDDDEYDDVY